MGKLADQDMSNSYVCATCGSIIKNPKASRNFSMMLVWIIIIFFTLGLGLILYILAGKKKKICNVCGNKNLLPYNSPMAQKILKDLGQINA